jgi:hypothetical protein
MTGRLRDAREQADVPVLPELRGSGAVAAVESPAGRVQLSWPAMFRLSCWMACNIRLVANA